MLFKSHTLVVFLSHIHLSFTLPPPDVLSPPGVPSPPDVSYPGAPIAHSIDDQTAKEQIKEISKDINVWPSHPQYSCNAPTWITDMYEDGRCCNCDDSCKYFGDCCLDKYSQNYRGKNYLNYFLQQTSIRTMFRYIPIMNKVHANPTHRFKKRYMIAKCGNTSSPYFKACNLVYSEKDFPVYDENGLIYRNADCAKCHNESAVNKKVTIIIKKCLYTPNQTFEEAINAGVEFSYDTFSNCEIDIRASTDYKDWFLFDPKKRFELNQGLKMNCSKTDELLCNSYMAIVKDDFGGLFANPNCAPCYSFYPKALNLDLNCRMEYAGYTDLTTQTTFSFSLMVSQSESDIKCEKNKIFDLIEGKCVDFYCKPGYAKEKERCKKITQKKVVIKPVSVDGNFVVKIKQCWEQLGGSIVYELPRNTINNLTIENRLKIAYKTNTSMYIMTNNGGNSVKHSIENMTEIKSKVYTLRKSLPLTHMYGLDYSRHFDSKVCISPKVYSVTNISNDCSPIADGRKYQLNGNATIWLVEHENKSTSSYVSVCYEFHLPSICSLKFISKNSYIFLKNNKSIYFAKKEYEPNMYYPDKNGVYICISFGSSKQKYEFEDQVWYIERLLSIIILFVSILAEIITLIVYSNCKDLRNTPGKIIMTIAVTLLVNDTLVIAMSFATLTQPICKILAIVLHLFSIALSVWSFVFAYDLWSTFRHTFRRRKNSKNDVLTYNLFVWFVSTAVIVLSLFIEYSTDFDVNYGKISDDLCWIRSRNARLVLYIAPVYSVLLLSGLLLLYIVFKIRRNSNTALSVQGKASQINITIMALKMLLALGIVEILAIIEISRANEKLAIANHVMTMLHNVARSLRGVFVLFIFVLTKPVLNKIKQEYTTRRETHQSYIASARQSSQL